MTDSNGKPALTGADMLALIAHMSNLLGEMEGRIMAQLSDNARGASARWKDHEEAHTQDSKRVEKVERALDDHIRATNAIFERMHDQEVATEARVKPVRTLAGFVAANWRSIGLAILALAGIFGWIGPRVAGQ